MHFKIWIKRIQRFLNDNILRIKMALLFVLLLTLFSIPMNLYFVVSEMKEIYFREEQSIGYRMDKIREQVKADKGIEKVDPIFFRELSEPGTLIRVVDEDKTTTYGSEINLAQVSTTQRVIELFITRYFVVPIDDRKGPSEYGEGISRRVYIDADKNLIAEISSNIEMGYSTNPNHLVKIRLQKNVSPHLSEPLYNFLKNFYYWLIWFVAVGLLSALLSIYITFRPLTKALAHSFEELKETNYRLKFAVTGKYGKEVFHFQSQINEILTYVQKIMNQHVETLQDISHEVNTHLTSIKQSVYVLHFSGNNSKDILESRLSSIDRNVDKITSITAMLMDMSSIKNRTPANVKATNYLAREMVNIYLELMWLLFPNTIFKAEVEDPDTVIYIEKEHFLIAIKPVVENAIKYSFSSSKGVLLRIYEKDNRTAVAVTNWGYKIDSDEIPFLFKRYYRGKNTKMIDNGGSGLGLSLTKEVLDLYNGDVEVVSVEEEEHYRNTFILWFPKEQKQE